jgi:transposase
VGSDFGFYSLSGIVVTEAVYGRAGFRYGWLFQILETRGFEVKLVNTHHIKTLPGRKIDILDCQWLQQLHS